MAIADAEDLVRCCEGCQFFVKQIHVSVQELQTILASWPFACWGLDMIGPFKPALGGSKSYQLWSRDCALKLVAAPVCLHISWSMAQKLYYQQILPSEHLGWKIMMKSEP